LDYQQVNDYLTSIFNNVLVIEESSLRGSQFKDVSIKEMHTIDVIGTDHAPHPAESKECEWACAANGMTGLEQALSIIQMTLVEPGHITWADVARIMSETPAKIGSLDAEQGRPLAEGEPANIVLVDPKATRVIKPEEQATKGKNNPYRGMEVPGAVQREPESKKRTRSHGNAHNIAAGFYACAA